MKNNTQLFESGFYDGDEFKSIEYPILMSLELKSIKRIHEQRKI